MGSRISVIEKRLDETHASLWKVDRLEDKSLVQSEEIEVLTRKVADLTTLLGVEDRFRGLISVNFVSALTATFPIFEERLHLGGTKR